MAKIGKRDCKYFDLFIATAEDICKTARMLQDLMVNFTDIDSKISEIENMEHKCDTHVHDMIKQLNKSFITPIDREDIFLIAKELDNITDAMEGAAHRFRMFNVTKIPPEALRLGELINECANELKSVMVELHNMKYNDSLLAKVIEVNRIEDEGDNVYRSTIQRLFKDEPNAIEIIKWKEIFEFLENTLDACEDVANIVEGVVMKHA